MCSSHFFRIKGADDFRSVLKTKSARHRRIKLKRVSKVWLSKSIRLIYLLAQDLQRLRAANTGQSTAFNRMLDIAYGRVGKLRRELIEVIACFHLPLSSLTTSASLCSRIRIIPTSQPINRKRGLVHPLTLQNSPLSLLLAFRARQGHCKNITLFHHQPYQDVQNLIPKMLCCWAR